MLKWEESSKKRHSTIQGGNSNLPIYLLTIFTHTHKKKIKNVYTEIQRVKNVETFNLKSSTDDAFLISRGRLFHSPTSLFIKLNLNKLVLERLVKRFGVSILLNAYPLSTSLENRTLQAREGCTGQEGYEERLLMAYGHEKERRANN